MHFETIDQPHTWMPRQRVYATMQRHAAHVSDYLELPLERVLEIDTAVRL